MKAKVKEFNGVVNINFRSDKVPPEGVHHTCIACISIDSVMKMEKRIINKFSSNNSSIKSRRKDA